MLDASNDNGLAKVYPITVGIFDINYSRVVTKFHNMILIEGANARTVAAVFSSLNKQFKKFQKSLKYWLTVSVDNKNVNIWDHNSIKSCALNKKIVPL